MRVIPVIDIKDGLVVRAVAGQRDRYEPICSILCEGARPASIATAFVEHFRFPEVYVADLDAIAGHSPNWDTYRTIMSLGLRLIVDSGIRDVEFALRLADSLSRVKGCAEIVVALESFSSKSDLKEVNHAAGSGQAIFSVDLHNGQLLTDEPSWKSSNVLQVVDDVVAAGFQRLIVLDLSQVGTGHGWHLANECQLIRRNYPSHELISGGGIQHVSDLKMLAANGCSAALIASALHDGRITAVDLNQAAWLELGSNSSLATAVSSRCYPDQSKR
jgi:phosphoribosylformimino-5-aminoimidazole carboxamide ribotide isomerase